MSRTYEELGCGCLISCDGGGGLIPCSFEDTNEYCKAKEYMDEDVVCKECNECSICYCDCNEIEEEQEQKCPVCRTRFIPGEVDIILDEHEKDVVIITTTEERITADQFLKEIENVGRKIVEAEKES